VGEDRVTSIEQRIMTFLPIVHRELRIASRKRGTYVSRAIVAGIVVILWLVISVANSSSMSTAELARTLFWTYGILAMLFALLSGVFFTADSLSAERRDGTLGLLFLTDLKGFDVVLGKLVATSWHGVYSLLVIVPVLALPLLMGGVSLMETARLVAVIGGSLFYSLALGLLISTLCRRLAVAVAVTVLILFLQGTLPWLVAVLLDEGFHWSAERNPVILLWPFTSLTMLQDISYQRGAGRNWLMGGAILFWLPLCVSVVLGIISLVSACVLLPRTWRREQQPSARQSSPAPVRVVPRGDEVMATPPPPVSAAVNRPRGLLEAHPCRWLAFQGRRHNRWLGATLMVLVVIWLVFLMPVLGERRGGVGEMLYVTALFGLFALHVLLKGWLALECGRRFCEDRQSGALELLLVTPVTEQEMIDGELAAIRETFKGPLFLITGVSMLFLLINVVFDPMNMNNDLPWFLEIIFYGALILWLDARAIAYTGMLTGLKATRQHRAVLGSIVRVLLPPWVGVILFFLMVILPSNLDEDGFVFSMRGWFALCALLDMMLILYARVTLREQLRSIAAGERGPLGGVTETPAP